MKRLIISLSVCLASALMWTTTSARPTIGLPVKKTSQVTPSNSSNKLMKYAANCTATTQFADLNVNNVRTRILNGGDMWWDLSNPKYEIPKIDDASTVRKHSLFAGAIWVGGLDDGGNLKLAAQTYRQRGEEFYAGPLDTVTSNTDLVRCKAWDKMFTVKRTELETFASNNFSLSDASDNILNWPGNGNESNNEAKRMAPFFDSDGDGYYSPASGEYPVLDPSKPAISNTVRDQPDQMIWFVYNDKGGIHQSGGAPIGLEMQTTAFAYATNDEVNNMTFYTTRIVNRGFGLLHKTYFGQWADPDLGNYIDDYIGCDVGRSLGYCYNGDDDDEGVLGYGLNPPSVGIDFFEGPVNENGVQLGLSKFMYFTNGAPYPFRDPDNAVEYYSFLQGRFQNNAPLTWGGNGTSGGTDTADFAFPDDTDPDHAGQVWTEKTGGMTPGDRRFVQSSGPFLLEPGVANKITVGVVWARTTSGGATGSLGLLKLASDKAQKLFNNKFDLVDGPDAPLTTITELDRQLVINFSGTDPIETYSEDFKNEQNQTLTYKFQGYLVYQLRDATVSNTDIRNVEKARLVFQCDLKDGVSQIVNKVFDPTVSASIPVEMVNGADKGLQHTVSLTQDAFSTSSNTTLSNFKTYYYLVLSYGYISNDPQKIDPDQFIAGRRYVKIQAVPHKSDPLLGGSELQAGYGNGPLLKRIEGTGNGGMDLEFTTETVNSILTSTDHRALNPVYMGGRGPVNVKVIDPVRVPKGNFKLVINEKGRPQITDSSTVRADSARWFLVKFNDNGENDTVFSDTTLRYNNEQLMNGVDSKGAKTPYDWGLSVTIAQTKNPGDPDDPTNGYITSEVIWQDPARQWLTAITDNDAPANYYWNWIRSGQHGKNDGFANEKYEDDFAINATSTDPFEVYERLWDRRMAPYVLASRAEADASTPPRVTYGPAAQTTIQERSLANLASVDLVITPDRSKWTRCVVVEQGEDAALNQGGIAKMNMRAGASLDKNYQPDGTGERGRSWFPGYAVNLETGERLNIIFAEDSYQGGNNGNDMIWNPTSNIALSSGSPYPANGGRHYIYIMGSQYALNKTYRGPRYDEGQEYYNLLNFATVPASNRNKVWSQAMWVIPTFMAQGYSMNNGVPLTEVRFRFRVSKTYGAYKTQDPPENGNNPVYTFSTEQIANVVSTDKGRRSMDLINIVPNPYYAYSQYETSPVDNRVKITNLPKRCDISIYTMNGMLVRRIKKDDERTFVDWDLKNTANVPIASGMYLIHVDGFDLGEKVLKWFGVMRQLDLDSY